MKLQNSRNQGFSYYFCLMIEGSGSRPLTNGSGSRRTKTYRSTTLIGVVVKLFQVLPPASNGIDLIHEDDAGLMIPECSQLFTFTNIKK